MKPRRMQSLLFDLDRRGSVKLAPMPRRERGDWCRVSLLPRETGEVGALIAHVDVPRSPCVIRAKPIIL